MKWPLMLICFLLPQSCIFGAPGSRKGCEFPKEWRGDWFQSGEQSLISINGTIMSNKGQCRASNDAKFLIVDTTYRCSRCLVIHEKHANVLQYKESDCTHDDMDIDKRCNLLAGDAPLLSLFRAGAAPSPCPFKGPLEFTYVRGSEQGECAFPRSQVESCTQETILFLRYSACADVKSSESTDVEVECLATWKEGSTNYLVGRLNSSGVVNDETRYRCFAYAKSSNATWNLAQSGDATCNGLTSTTEGATTIKLIQKSEPVRCSYPSWLVSAQSWVALDQTASAKLLASTNNITILDQNETQFACHTIVRTEPKRSTNVDYYSSIQMEQVQLIAKATRDCTNGYVCLAIHQRDSHVIEIQQSQNWTQQPDDACKLAIFNSTSAPYMTFITLEPRTRQCPYLGRYNVVFVTIPPSAGYSENALLRGDQRSHNPYKENVAEVRSNRMTTPSSPNRCHPENIEALEIGCTNPDLMEFATTCSDKTQYKYSCHGTWVENDTAYLVASTEAGRYCLVYMASAATTPNRELTVIGYLASCPRASHLHKREWQVHLTAYAQCDDVTSSSPWKSSGSPLSVHFLILLVTIINGCVGR